MEKVKNKNSIQPFSFSASTTEAEHSLGSRSATSKLLPWNYTQHLSIICHSFLNGICEHLGSISVYVVHLVAGRVLRNQKSLRELMRLITSSVQLFIIKILDCGE